MIIFLCFIVALQFIALYLSIKRNLEFLDEFDSVVETYKEMLQELNYYYERIDKKSKLELFLDEPVTRELIEDIKGTKKVIRKSAEKISVFIENETEES